MMVERFMVDDAGTLIDMQTRDTYDYVSDVVDTLNYYEKENEWLRVRLAIWEGVKQDEIKSIFDENKQLKSQNQYLKSLKWNQDCIDEISIGMQQRQSLEIHNNKLIKENERLKKEVEDLKQIYQKKEITYDSVDEAIYER